jgi:hypothetical protein
VFTTGRRTRTLPALEVARRGGETRGAMYPERRPERSTKRSWPEGEKEWRAKGDTESTWRLKISEFSGGTGLEAIPTTRDPTTKINKERQRVPGGR